MRTRLARTITDEYRSDALADLAFVLLDSGLDGPGLAARLVNRAHNRTHKADQRVRTRGIVNVMTVTPREPEHFNRCYGNHEDVAAVAAVDASVATILASAAHSPATQASGSSARARLRRTLAP